jgi:quinol monooxygenase YgiN
MFTIHAFFKVEPKHRDEFLAVAKKVVEGTRTEEGNISYNLLEDAEQPNVFVFLEKWQDQNALDIHEKTPHFGEFVKAVKGLLLEPFTADVFEVVAKK